MYLTELYYTVKLESWVNVENDGKGQYKIHEL
jgi:hypothetical protein